jgi:hypothetical protein
MSKASHQHILVLGATGKTGSQVVPRLRDQEVDKRAAARTGADVHFDWNDPTTFEAALTGMSGVFLDHRRLERVRSQEPLAVPLREQSRDKTGQPRVRTASSAGHRPSPSTAACRFSAGGGTVRLTASASFNRLAGLEGTYAVALAAPDTYSQQSLDATCSPRETCFARRAGLCAVAGSSGSAAGGDRQTK